MNAVGVLHTACGVIALVLGAAVFLRPKGTRFHVRLGWAFVGCMVVVNVSALTIYHLTGRPNLFHVLAVGILAMLTIGVAQVAARQRPRRWAWRHYQYMSWAYVGLLAATNNEAFVRIPVLVRLANQTTAALPLLATSVLVAICGMVIYRQQGRMLAPFQPDRR